MPRIRLLAIPDMMKKATEPALFDRLEHHLDETRELVGRLEQIFKALGAGTEGGNVSGDPRPTRGRR